MNRGTLTQLFFTTVDRHAGLPAAFRSKVGGAWVSITHREALERVQAISVGQTFAAGAVTGITVDGGKTVEIALTIWASSRAIRSR